MEKNSHQIKKKRNFKFLAKEHQMKQEEVVAVNSFLDSMARSILLILVTQRNLKSPFSTT